MNPSTDICWGFTFGPMTVCLTERIEFQRVLFFSTLFIYSASLISLNPLQYVQTIIRWQPCLSTVPSSPCPCFYACLSLLLFTFWANLTKTLPYVQYTSELIICQTYFIGFYTHPRK